MVRASLLNTKAARRCLTEGAEKSVKPLARLSGKDCAHAFDVDSNVQILVRFMEPLRLQIRRYCRSD